MHVGYRVLCGLWRVVNDVGDTAVGVECTVHWHVNVFDCAVDAKYFSNVWNSDVFREFLDNNLERMLG